MEQFILDFVEKYAKDFRYELVAADDVATITTDYGTFGISQVGDEVKLLLGQPLDDNDDTQIKNLLKLRKHFVGAWRDVMAKYQEDKKVEKDPAEKTVDKPASKKGRPPKAPKEPVVPAADPVDAPVEPDKPAQAQEEAPDSIRPTFDETEKEIPLIFKTMLTRAAETDLQVVSQSADELIMEGEYGRVTVTKDGEIDTEVTGYRNALNGKKAAPPKVPATTPKAPQTAPTSPAPATPKTGCIYDQIIAHLGPDLLEVFGDTGTLKSKGMVAMAMECAKAGRKVYYLDTENNISPKDVAQLRALGVLYEYTPVLKQIDEIIEKKIPNMAVDLIIIDSVGMPVLRKFSAMGAHERGTALLDIIKWLGTLKEWTFMKKSIAIVTNQPQSEFGKTSAADKGDNRMPFGDKSNFIPGALLLAKKTLDSKNGSTAQFQAFRLRDHARGEIIFTVNASSQGSTITMNV